MDDVGIPAPRPEPERADSPAVLARFDADCPLCHLGIHTGQLVVHTTRNRWVHERCAVDP
jgi:hypothetical protein